MFPDNTQNGPTGFIVRIYTYQCRKPLISDELPFLPHTVHLIEHVSVDDVFQNEEYLRVGDIDAEIEDIQTQYEGADSEHASV